MDVCSDSRYIVDPMLRLRSSIWLPAERDDVFAFFSHAHNLEQLTPPWLRFRIVTPGPIEMRKGTMIDYRLRVRGVPLRWRSEISVWQPPERFVDEQRRGPYRTWIHEHRFDEQEGGTRCVDRVDFAVMGGWPVARLLVAPDVRRIFQYRQERLAERFGGSARASSIEFERLR